jgi:hypothetical protein
VNAPVTAPVNAPIAAQVAVDSNSTAVTSTPGGVIGAPISRPTVTTPPVERRPVATPVPASSPPDDGEEVPPAAEPVEQEVVEKPVAATPRRLKFTQMPLDTRVVLDWQARDFDHVYGVFMNKITTTSDAGRTWKTKDVGKVPLFSVFFADEQTGWVAGQNGVLFKTSNAGKDWKLIDTGHSMTIWDLAFTDESNGFMLTLGTPGNPDASAVSILKTDDGGESWSSTTVLSIDHSFSNYYVETGDETYIRYLIEYGHLRRPNLFLDHKNQVWFNAYKDGYKSLYYYHDGAFENVIGDDQAHPYVGPDRLWFMNFGNQGLGLATYTKNFVDEDMLGPDFVTPSQIHRNLGLSNVVQFEDKSIRAFTKNDAGFVYLDSSDEGDTWTDPAKVDGMVPESILAFDKTRYWGWHTGILYRAGL